MTPDELRALADRAIACPRWRPMRGMRDLQGRTWTPDLLWRWHPHDRPDLSDPATLGCLLALVRAAYAAPHLYVAPGDGWHVIASERDGVVGRGATVAEALVVALEAAP